jgi:glyoxylase-like metal-dependent hydrolase (beta-lactamase superfamily II)
MKIHHLDCAAMCPAAQRAISGSGSMFVRGTMPAHCLLIETPASGLVLVDTGFGTADVRDPGPRLGGAFAALLAPSSDPAVCALEQVKKLGHDPRDVRHVIVTHLDLDHAGGLPDFPWAKVHVHRIEQDAALSPTWRERERYRRAHFAHQPDFLPYDREGEPWNGFAAVRDLPGLPPEILAIPMPGHTRGHACIAVDRGDRWLVHAGDAYFHPARLRGEGAPFGLQLFERLVATDYRKVLENHRRLGELTGVAGVTVFCAHDPSELSALQSAAG